MSGSGKSTVAQRLYRHLIQQNHPTKWLHEEIRQHPIRHQEFQTININNSLDFDVQCNVMLDRWRALVAHIQSNQEIVIIEGCLYQNIIRYFLDAHIPLSKMTRFYDNVMDILQPLHPLLVFLRPSSVETALQQVFEQRGVWWKRLILTPNRQGYFKEVPYKNEHSIYQMWEHYQQIADYQFYRYNGSKLRFDPLFQRVNEIIYEILKECEVPFEEIVIQGIQPYWIHYCGDYQATIDQQKRKIRIFIEENNLYCRGFWPQMRLLPIKEHHFEFDSFPMELNFSQIDSTWQFTITGDYDWEVLDHMFIKNDSSHNQ